MRPFVQYVYSFGIHKSYSFFSLLVFYSHVFEVGRTVDVLRPRGVPLSKVSFYQADKQFTCLDGSNTIPFNMVNDDYCDCSDGTDEPGTAACPNGIFHCPNQQHIPKDIIASLVNDGICDCCDGSDEYGSRTKCSNTCEELGRKVREAAERQAQEMNDGFALRDALINQAKEIRENKQIELADLNKQKEDLEIEKTNLEAGKQAAEEAEKVNKDIHQQKWDEEKARRDAESQLLKIKAAFTDLDTNSDGIVSEEELLVRPEFDVDSDGSITRQELAELLGDEALHYDYDTFHERIWDEIKDVYVPTKSEGSEAEEEQEVTPTPASFDVDEDYPDEDYPEEEDDDDIDSDDVGDPDLAQAPSPPDVSRKLSLPDGVVPDEDMPEYDDETKALIQAADAARAAYDDCASKLSRVISQVGQIERTLAHDAGLSDEYLHMEGECYELEEKEYIYRLCMFDKVVQKPRHGGSDTNLGIWSGWTGEPSKYSQMTFDNGVQCWNGPQRSTKVSVSCGEENRIMSASEPNRCEYVMEFVSPAACTQQVTADDIIRSEHGHRSHDEL